jgi:hypothetical protein
LAFSKNRTRHQIQILGALCDSVFVSKSRDKGF